METATEAPTVQQAFQAAKEEHSAAAERALPAEKSPGAAPESQTDEAKAQPPTADSAQPEISDLISDEELQSLRTTTGNDPDKLAKELKAVFTKKTQALAAERKQVAKLAEYADFIADLDTDPAGALTRAAEQLGLVVSPKPAEVKATEAASSIVQDVSAQVAAALGPELDFLAPAITKAIEAVVEPRLKHAIGEAVEPVKAAQQALVDKASAEQTEATLKAFTDRHPDWKQHEPAMLKVGILPSPGMTELDFMEALYTLATKDAVVAKATKAAIDRLTKGAATAEGKDAPLSGDKVTVSRPAHPTIAEAFAAAKRGERWE